MIINILCGIGIIFVGLLAILALMILFVWFVLLFASDRGLLIAQIKYPGLLKEHPHLEGDVEVVNLWATDRGFLCMRYVKVLPLIAPFTDDKFLEERWRQFGGEPPNAEIEAEAKEALINFYNGLMDIKPEKRIRKNNWFVSRWMYYDHLWFLYVIRDHLSKGCYVHATHTMMDLWTHFPILEERFYTTIVHMLGYYLDKPVDLPSDSCYNHEEEISLLEHGGNNQP